MDFSRYADETAALEDEHFDAYVDPDTAGEWLSPFLPAPPERLEALAELQLGLGPEDTALDLGCGDGRVLAFLSRTFGCRGVGVDISAACIARAEELLRAEGVEERVRVLQGDLTSDALHAELLACGEGGRAPAVVTAYIYPTLVARLQALLGALRAAGARVVTVEYHPPEEWGWEHSAEDRRGEVRVYGPVVGGQVDPAQAES